QGGQSACRGGDAQCQERDRPREGAGRTGGDGGADRRDHALPAQIRLAAHERTARSRGPLAFAAQRRHFLSFPTWLPITPPTAAPPSVPAVLPTTAAPAAAPTPAPIAVLFSRCDMLSHAPSASTLSARVDVRASRCIAFMRDSFEERGASAPRDAFTVARAGVAVDRPGERRAVGAFLQRRGADQRKSGASGSSLGLSCPGASAKCRRSSASTAPIAALSPCSCWCARNASRIVPT